MADFLSGFAGIIIGWATQVYFNRRQELRSRIAETIHVVDQVCDLAEQYWSTDLEENRRVITSSRIKSQICEISINLSRFTKFYRSFSPPSEQVLIQFRQAVTAAPFDEKNVKLQPHRMVEILRTATALKDAIRDGQKWHIRFQARG